MKHLICLFLLLFLASCATTRKPYYSNETKDWASSNKKEANQSIHTLYLIGDTGFKKGVEANFVLPQVQKMLEKENNESSIVFLGNQIYFNGMPKRKSEDRSRAESVLNEQLNILKNYKGRAYFIPGDKDWNNGKAKGLKALLRQEEYIEDFFSQKNKAKMYPGNGCADPKVVKINKDLIFVFLDTQWWIQNWSEEKAINKGCDIKSRYDLLKHIEEVLTEHKNDEVVLFMHHPIKSNGVHGGHLSFNDHLFPYKESHNFSIPIPFIGSFIALFRNIKGTKQDLANDHYKELMDGIDALAHKLGVKTIYASSHDNGLQYFDEDKLQYIISGSGSRTNRTVKGSGASFSQEARGFCKISFFQNYEAWLEIFTIDGPGRPAQKVYQKQIFKPRPGSVDVETEFPSISTRDTIVAASTEFLSSRFKEFFLGDQYRTMWGTPVKAPFINLEEQFGGLIPIKKGGGMASNSLRMETRSGKQYILRSIKKDYRKLVPPGFGNLKVLDILKDQNSASHPYGALILPKLSRAAGIYYTYPRLVYLKHQRGLGNYNSQFPEELYLLEERPSDNWSDADQFGNSANIIGYNDLLSILREKKNHFVDQKWTLKSRMFDLLIHDWDRHDDQWRWASFEDEEKTIYRPIPRDRDQVFYKFKGIIPSYISTFMVKKFKTMKDDLKDVKNQSFNARYFDRYFLNALSWEEWKPIIKQLQNSLTDEIIDQSISGFPEEIRDLHAEELGNMLKSRRDKLQSIGRSLYDFISKEVEVSGSDDEDVFTVSFQNEGSILVKMYNKRKNKGDLLKYERVFYPSETKEIRLYGLRGQDEFNILGNQKTKISLRIIGGEDKDIVSNTSTENAVFVYDEPGGIKISGTKIIDRTSGDLDVNDYDRTGFRYNGSNFLPFFGWTKDDGFWIGGSIFLTNHGWRKSPYKSKQKFSLSFVPGKQDVLKFNFESHIPHMIGPLDFAPKVGIDFPSYENYFGLGNESINLYREKQFNWVRMTSLEVSPLLSITSKDNSTLFRFGPTYESHDIKKTENRIATDEEFGFKEKEFERRNFGGAHLDLTSGFADSKNFPTYGFLLVSSFRYLNGISHDENVTEFSAAIHTYLPLFRSPVFVLANKFGFQKSWGSLQFYQYPDLGNNTNLRGYRNNRFRGETLFYHNIDLRLHLFDWDNNVAPMGIGLVGGYDYGRVWLEEEASKRWHRSQTIGVWFNILDVIVLQPHYSFTEERDLFSFKLGFNF